MAPKAFIHHDLPGRLRIHIPSHKGIDSFFRELGLKLGDCEAIDGAHVNARTGSILIYYTGGKKIISEFAKDNNLFLLLSKNQDFPKYSYTPTKKISSYIQTLDQKITQKSEGELDLSFLTASGLAGLGLIQAINGKFLPPAWTLIFQAIDVIRKYQSRENKY